MPTIAIIGASTDRSKFGNKCVRAYQSRGYQVFPIHPKETEIEGLPAFRSIRDVPAEFIDRVSVYLAPALGIQILDDIATMPVGEVWLNPGADAPEVIARGRELKLHIIAACSIVDIGVSPYQLDG